MKKSGISIKNNEEISTDSRIPDTFPSRKSRNKLKHYCELLKNSESTLPRLPPNVKLILRLKRLFQKLIIVWNYHPYTKLYLRSKSAISCEKKRHARSSNWWIIHPLSKLRFFWDIIMILTFIYYFIIIPYVKSFYRISNRKNYYQYYLIYPAFGICFIDIFMSFITGYVTQDGAEIIIDYQLIVRNYCQGYFLLDLITSAPWTFFEILKLTEPGPDVNFLAFILEIIPLLKIFRMPTLRYYVKQLNSSFGFNSISDIIIWLILLTVLIIHWSACLTWAFPFIILYATREEIKNSDAFVIKTGIYNENSWYIYLMSLHMGVSNLIGSNFIELMDISFGDEFIRCFLFIFGSGYMIYLIVIFLQFVECLAEPQLKYQEIINRVQEYIKNKNLPKALGDRLIKYYEYRFQGNYFKENVIVNTLSNHLRFEINIRSNKGLLEAAKILHCLPRPLLAQLMKGMTPVIYLENDVIYKYGDEGDSMYFISSGTVTMINSIGKELGHLIDGDYFGELSILHLNKPREVTIVTIEICELLQLHRRTFNRLILPESEFYHKLSEISEVRIKEIEILNEKFQREEDEKKQRRAEYKKLLMRTTDVLSLNSNFSS